MGGPVRTPILWVPAGPQLCRRDRCLFTTLKGPRAKRVWVLDADLAAAFDRIDHAHLLAAIGAFPARDMVQRWLKGGVFENGEGSRRPRREPPRAA